MHVFVFFLFQFRIYLTLHMYGVSDMLTSYVNKPPLFTLISCASLVYNIISVISRAGEKLEEAEQEKGKRGGKEGRISFYFPPGV